MPPFLENLKAKIFQIWNDSSVSQRIMVGGLAATMVLIFSCSCTGSADRITPCCTTV